MDLSNKKQLEEAIKNGLPCYYQYGFTFKGAGKRRITQEKALQELPHYSPGMGFYELWEGKTESGEPCLVFNEYSENDLL